MSCQPGYIEIDGNCIYEFGSETQPDGTPTGGFWQNAGDFVKENAGGILVILGGILSGKKADDPADQHTSQPAPEPPKKDRTLLWVGIGIVVVVGIALLVRSKGKMPAA